MTKIINTRPAIALFAYSQPGFACFKELLALGANISAVFTHIDADDENIWFDSVYDLAIRNNIPVCRGKKIDEKAYALFQKVTPDIIISAYYRAIIPDEMLDAVHLGAFNLHGSLLPKYRGRACINWAVLNGETISGVTMHMMTAKADKGDIVARETYPIKFVDTGHDAFIKASQAVQKIIKRTLSQLEQHNFPRMVQDEKKATKFGRRRPEDGIIHWQDPAVKIYNLIRSVTHPFPGAFTFAADKKIFIWWALPVSTEKLIAQYHFTVRQLTSLIPGMLAKNDGQVAVRCGRDFLLLKKLSLIDGHDYSPADSQISSLLKAKFTDKL